ncbi:nucleotide pyrophosphohydrolase [Candidatus Pacearchaeota archaeon]|nr:MAG: nucleotide pyrophosphohydrolase [Candidatus Pacearchaeota archaeon]
MSDFISLREMQIEVDNWVNQFTPAYWPPLSIMAQLTEETGELARNLNNLYGGRVKKNSDKTKEISEEICDIMFALVCLANSHNINLDKAWKKTISARCKRDMNRFERK